MKLFLGLIIPFIGTTLGASMVFLMKNKLNNKVEELIPESQIGKHSDLGTIGFSIGFIIMMILDVALG